MSKTIKWLAKEQYPLTHNDEVFQFNLSACLRRKAIAKEPRSSKHRHYSIRLYILQD